MQKKYTLLKYVNRKHSLFTRSVLGSAFYLFILLITKSTIMAKLSFDDFFLDDFKLGLRRILKLLYIFLGVEFIKDETFNFCENATKNQLNFLSKKLKKDFKRKESLELKGQYLYILAGLIEIDSNKKTKIINQFNKLSQEIIDTANYNYDKEGFENKVKNNSLRKGDFVINDAISALSDWNDLFVKEKYKWFVISGTFLGLIREGGFLKHDYDIDLGIHSKDFLFENIFGKIKKTKNFVIKKIDFLKEGVCKNDSYLMTCKKQIVLLKIIHRTGLNIDLFIHYSEKDICWHGSSFHRWDNNIFNLKTYNLHGIEVFGPENSELYLTENYGNWRVPVTDFHFHTGTPNLSIIRNPSSIAMFVKRISELKSKKNFLKIKHVLKKAKILSKEDIFDLRLI